MEQRATQLVAQAFVGSEEVEGMGLEPSTLDRFRLWLVQRGNRDSTIDRKLKRLRKLHGTPLQMVEQVLQKPWVDKSKMNALDTVCQYAEFLGQPIQKPKFRVYDDREVFVPTPEMVKQFVFRVRSIRNRAMLMIAVETGATASEVFNLTWSDLSFERRTLTIHGVKGHRTFAYPISDGLLCLLTQLPRNGARIFSHLSHSRYINDSIVTDYRKRLVRETGNPDFNKIHFHSFRHFAISWHYFKTKDLVETQRFARHCNVQNTLKYIHIVKSWVRDEQFDVVYAASKEDLSRYLSEGYTFITKSEWGYVLRRPKMLV